MTTKKTNTTEEAAKAAFTLDSQKSQEIIVKTAHLTDVIKAHPAYATTPTMQQSVTAITSITQTLSKQESDIQSARASLKSLIAARELTVHAFGRARRTLLSAVDEIAAGSAAALTEWGFGVQTRQPLPTSDAPPANLHVRYTRALVMVIAWKHVPGQRGYAIQIGDGTPQGWGAAIQCPKASYTPTGLTPGQKIAIRVAVQRKNGLSTWSEALSATVR